MHDSTNLTSVKVTAHQNSLSSEDIFASSLTIISSNYHYYFLKYISWKEEMGLYPIFSKHIGTTQSTQKHESTHTY